MLAAEPPLPTLPKEFASIRWLAEGGMSWVYTSHYKPLDRIEIIKLLKPDTRERADAFLREGRAMARLSSRYFHPNICQVFDVGRCPEGPYIRMEYIEGPTLQEFLEEGSGPTLEEILRLATDLADALDHAHARGVVHSDLKPENVLLTVNERTGEKIPKLIDFGIARHPAASTDNDELVRGTLPYMAPEQLRGDGPTAHSDQYALGVMVFELLTGLLPFTGPRDSIVDGHLRGDVPKLQPELAELQPTIERALAKRIHQRFPNCASFAAAMMALVERSTKIAGLLGIRPRTLMTHDVRMAIENPARIIKPKVNTEHFTQSVRPFEALRSLARRATAELATRAGALSATPRAFELKGYLAEMASSAPDTRTLGQIEDFFLEVQLELGGRLSLDDVREVLRARRGALDAIELLAQAHAAAIAGNWLPPAPGNALHSIRLAIASDADNADAQRLLQELPAKLCQAIDAQLEQTSTERARRLFEGAIAEFPSDPGLATLKKKLDAAILAEQDLRRMDAEFARLAADFAGAPPTLSARILDDLAMANSRAHPLPGAIALKRVVDAWVEGLAKLEDPRLAAAKRAAAPLWETLARHKDWSRQMQALGSRVDSYEEAVAMKARAEQRRRRIEAINKVCEAEEAFSLGSDGILSALAGANAAGLESEAASALLRHQQTLCRRARALASASPEAARSFDPWFDKATDAGMPGRLLVAIRAVVSDALQVHEVRRRFDNTTREFASGRIPDASAVALFNEALQRASQESLAESLSKLSDAWLGEIAKCRESERFAELLKFDRTFSSSRLAEGAQGKALLELARMRLGEARIRVEQQNDLRAFVASVEAFEAAPTLGRLRKAETDLAKLADAVDVAPLIARVIAAVEPELEGLLARKEWRETVDWIHAGQPFAGTEWSRAWQAQVDAQKQRENARLLQSRLRLMTENVASRPAESFAEVASQWLGLSEEDRSSAGAGAFVDAVRAWLTRASAAELLAVRQRAGIRWNEMALDKRLCEVMSDAERRIGEHQGKQLAFERLRAACAPSNLLREDGSGLLPCLEVAIAQGLRADAEALLREELANIESAALAELRRSAGRSSTLTRWLPEFRRVVGPAFGDALASAVEREKVVLSLEQAAPGILACLDGGKAPSDDPIAQLRTVFANNWAVAEPRVLAIIDRLVVAAQAACRSSAGALQLQAAGDLVALLREQSGPDAKGLQLKADQLEHTLRAVREQAEAQRREADRQAVAQRLSAMCKKLESRPQAHLPEALQALAQTSQDVTTAALRARLAQLIAEACEELPIADLKVVRDRIETAFATRGEQVGAEIVRLRPLVADLVQRREAAERLQAIRSQLELSLTPDLILDLGPAGFVGMYGEAMRTEHANQIRQQLGLLLDSLESALRTSARQRDYNGAELENWLTMFGKGESTARLPPEVESIVFSVASELRLRTFLSSLRTSIESGASPLPDVSRAAHDVSRLGSRCRFLADEFRLLHESLATAVRMASDVQQLDVLDDVATFVDFGRGQAAPDIGLPESLASLIATRRAELSLDGEQQLAREKVALFLLMPNLQVLRELASGTLRNLVPQSEWEDVCRIIEEKLAELQAQRQRRPLAQWIDAAAPLFPAGSLAQRFRIVEEHRREPEPARDQQAAAQTVALPNPLPPPVAPEAPASRGSGRLVLAIAAALLLALSIAWNYWPRPVVTPANPTVAIPAPSDSPEAPPSEAALEAEEFRTLLITGIIFAPNGGGAWGMVERAQGPQRQAFMREFADTLRAKVRSLADSDLTNAKSLVATARNYMQHSMQALDLLAELDAILSQASVSAGLKSLASDPTKRPADLLAIASAARSLSTQSSVSGGGSQVLKDVWGQILEEAQRQRVVGEIAVATELLQRAIVILGSSPAADALAAELAAAPRVTLTIDAKPWAEIVRVELPGGWTLARPAGEDLVATTPQALKVAPGTYSVSLRHPGGGIEYRSVKVGAQGGPARVFVSFDVVDIDALLQAPNG